jgi:hypothetical protein
MAEKLKEWGHMNWKEYWRKKKAAGWKPKSKADAKKAIKEFRMGNLKEAVSELSPMERNQLRVAQQTLKMPDAMLGVMGGPSKEEAKAIILKITSRIHAARWTEPVTESINPGVKSAALDILAQFNQHGNILRRANTLSEVAEKLSGISKVLEGVLLHDSEDWFDAHTIKRDTREIKQYSDSFAKFAIEADNLHQRLTALYDDMGHKIQRYVDVTADPEETSIVKEDSGMDKTQVLVKDAPERDIDPEHVNRQDEDITDFTASQVPTGGGTNNPGRIKPCYWPGCDGSVLLSGRCDTCHKRSRLPGSGNKVIRTEGGPGSGRTALSGIAGTPGPHADQDSASALAGGFSQYPRGTNGNEDEPTDFEKKNAGHPTASRDAILALAGGHEDESIVKEDEGPDTSKGVQDISGHNKIMDPTVLIMFGRQVFGTSVAKPSLIVRGLAFQNRVQAADLAQWIKKNQNEPVSIRLVTGAKTRSATIGKLAQLADLKF